MDLDIFSYYQRLRDKEQTIVREFYESYRPGVPYRRPPAASVSGWKEAESMGARTSRVREALRDSKGIALDELYRRFNDINLSVIGEILIDICIDMALYIGGSVVVGMGLGAIGGLLFGGIGAIPGAAAGAAAGLSVGGMLMNLLGLKSLAEYISDAIPSALEKYQEGFKSAWGSDPGVQSSMATKGFPTEGNVFFASHKFADGHIIIVTAMLMAIAAYLTRGRGDKAILIQEMRQSKRFGDKAADWVLQNESKIINEPKLRPQQNAGISNEAKIAGKPSQTPAQISKQAEESIPEKPKLKDNKEKALYGEARGREYMEKRGFEKLSGDKGWNAPGLDDLYRNPHPPPDYVIAEYKYGTSDLGRTTDGRQMSDNWVLGKKSGRDRLGNAVGRIQADKVRDALDAGKVEKWLLRVTEDGNVSKSLLGKTGTVTRGSVK